MFDKNINSEFLVELSEEQQQLVSGGSGYGDAIKDKLSTYYKADTAITLLEVGQKSGPEGSTNLQNFQHDTFDIKTAAYKDFFALLR